MKLAAIVVEGTTQIAFTPENEWEQRVLEQVKRHAGSLSILTGHVFECQGDYWRVTHYGEERGFSDLILRLNAPDAPRPGEVLP